MIEEYIKLLLGVGVGKRQADKRETQKKRDWNKQKSPPYERTGLNLPIYVALGANQNSIFNGQSHTPIHTFKLVFKELTDAGIDVVNISGVWQSPGLAGS